MKDIVFDCIKRTSDVMCVWDCCWLWIRTAEVRRCHQTKYFIDLLPGPVHHRVWPLHRALHHLVHRGQCLVHECWPLWCGVWWNVSILITWLIFWWWCWCQTIRNNLISLSRSPFFNSMLTNGNYFFTAIFAVESFVKLFAMSPRYFFAVNN